ncbi:SMEK domain-containing protein [Burkholderia cenocepacia]|uniref:SMEK domain-containing protein n=1 Tax=Burkholderia cenocepacia TaxID=95486 RepID=UPI001F4A12C1|nr:SMEK domain-containing protein [Burkholderia cenocepacia]
MPIDSIQTLADRLAIYLAAYKHYVDIKSKGHLLDVAIFGEPFARDLAEIVFGYKDLVSLNLRKSFPAVDLGSLAMACAIQVTISGDSRKIVETQRKFFENGLDSTYSKLKFIVLKGKQGRYDGRQIVREKGNFSFDPDHDIYDLNDLFEMLVAEGNPKKFEAFANRLESEIGSAIRPFLLDVDRPGQRLRHLFCAHDVSPTDAVQALKPFGMSRSIFSDSMSLAESASNELIRYVAAQFWVGEKWIDGIDSHIYSDFPGGERGTEWRRSLRGASDLVQRARIAGEALSIVVPTESSLRELDAVADVVDHRDSNYEHFFLIARKANDFRTDSFRLVISDSLSYRKCREGIFLLFLAAEIYEVEAGKKTYIDVYEAPRENILRCSMGEIFVVDLLRTGCIVRNHKDFVYSDGTSALKATEALPKRLAPWLQENLAEFVAHRSSSLPGAISFP